jgi:RHS repeat-associated protein
MRKTVRLTIIASYAPLTNISAYQNSSTYTYDDLKQVETESTFLGAGGPQGNLLYAERTYAYDANGNRTGEERTDVLPNLAGTTAVMRGYAATADDRLVSYTQSSSAPSLQYSAAYTHDARGNRSDRQFQVSSFQSQAAYGYDAFGRMLSDNPSSLTAYRFSSKEWDADAQLYYFGFRWYDPDTGTWTSKDPLGFSGGDINVLSMLHNNAVISADPYGLDRRIVVGPIHTWIRVDVYDVKGNVTGQKDLHITPFTGNRSDFLITDPKDSYPGIVVWSKCSNQQEDEELLAFWETAINGKVTPYDGLLRNCITGTIALRNVGINR